jgi:hypothetical protein
VAIGSNRNGITALRSKKKKGKKKGVRRETQSLIRFFFHTTLAMRGVLTAFCLSLCALASGTEYKLKLAPAAPLSQQLYRNSSLSSWGGNVLHAGDEGDIYAYHLFAAGFTNGCGLSGWESNSFVLHAVSQSPVGPFEFHDVALPVWHHNPQAIRAPDGL